MQDSSFILLTVLILGATSWLDGIFSYLKIKKLYALIAAGVLLLISDLAFDVYTVSIMPATVILTAAATAYALYTGQFRLFPVTVLCTVLSVFSAALLYLMPTVQLMHIMLIFAFILGILMRKQPCAAAAICVIVPFAVYTFSLFADYYLFIGSNMPDMREVMRSQTIGCIAAVLSAYVYTISAKQKSSQHNREVENG